MAFLRGVNVGGHRVKMDHLRGLFEAIGLANVATYIASGNVIFEADGAGAAEVEGRIEAHLGRSLGYGVETFLRTPGELAAVAALDPFPSEGAGATVHVGFLRGAPGEAVARALGALRTEKDEFLVRGRELFWLCRGKVTDSLVSWPVVAKAIAMPSTMRNLTTVRKLAALYPPG